MKENMNPDPAIPIALGRNPVSGGEVIGHIMADGTIRSMDGEDLELEFDFNSRTRFLDMESGEEIITEPWHIRSNYTELISGLQKYYQKECRESLIDYVPIFTDENLDKSITGYLNKRRKLF